MPQTHLASAAGVVLATDTMCAFTLNSFKITDTRARHNDTDYVSIAVAVGNKPPITATKAMGDVNNGTHTVSLSIRNVEVGRNETVAFSYSIINSGHNKSEIEKALAEVVSAAASKGATAAAGAVGGALGGPIGSAVGAVGTKAFGWVANEIEGIIFANCDGPVAAGDHVFSGAQLAELAKSGHSLSKIDDNKGTDTPWGCGGNSRYYVTWALSAQIHQIVPALKKS
jgi:hypothetical protein